jgi:hypothetical protein
MITGAFAVDFDLHTYYVVMSAVTLHLLVMEQQKEEFTPIRELQQIGQLCKC